MHQIWVAVVAVGLLAGCTVDYVVERPSPVATACANPYPGDSVIHFNVRLTVRDNGRTVTTITCPSFPSGAELSNLTAGGARLLRLRRTLGDDLHKISVGVAQQGIPIVIAGVVRRLNHRHPRGHEVSVGGIDVVRPHNQDHGRAAG
jgi:hypothetical protein